MLISYFVISADPSLRGSAPRSLVCVCLVPDHTPAGVRVFRKRSFSTCCATFRHFFYLLFRMAWVRIWMLFECFGSASPRALEAGDSSFLVRSVGDVSAVFRAAVSHGLGTYSLGINPAAVPLFRKRFSKSFLALILPRLFARVSHGLGLNPSSFFTRSLGNVRQFSGSILLLFRCFGSVSPSHSLH